MGVFKTSYKNRYNEVLPPIISRKARYLFIGLAIGTLLIVASVILPWVTLDTGSGILNQDGFGLYSGDPGLVATASKGGVVAQRLNYEGQNWDLNAPLGWHDAGTFTLWGLLLVLVFSVLIYVAEADSGMSYNFFLFMFAGILTLMPSISLTQAPVGYSQVSNRARDFDHIYVGDTSISVGLGPYLALLGCLIIDITLYIVFKRMRPKPVPQTTPPTPTQWPKPSN